MLDIKFTALLDFLAWLRARYPEPPKSLGDDEIKNHQLSWWFDREPLKAVLKDSATWGLDYGIMES